MGFNCGEPVVSDKLKNNGFRCVEVAGKRWIPEWRGDEATYMLTTDYLNFPAFDPGLYVVKRTPWRRKMWNRLKGAWSLLLRGDDHHE